MAEDQIEAGGRRPCTVVTAIFAPDERLAATAIASMEATQREFPDDRRIAALDAATGPVRDHARAHGWELLELEEGRPPRMGRLLKLALDRCQTDVYVTVEHDVMPLPGSRGIIDVLLAHPELGGVEAMTVNAAGRMHYPTSYKWHKCMPWRDGLTLVLPHASLCCVAFRTEALRQVDWSLIPNYPNTDIILSRLLRRAGWELVVSPEHRARHLFVGARKGLPKNWREHIESAE